MSGNSRILFKKDVTGNESVDHPATLPSLDFPFGVLSVSFRLAVLPKDNPPGSMTGCEAFCRSVVVEQAIVGVGGTADVVSTSLIIL